MQETVKQDRWKYIGGSDIPIIMGISHFKSRWDLLLEKAQLKEDDFDGNEYTEYGNVLEGKIRDFINGMVKKPFKEDKVIKGDFRYHSDGFNGECVLEVKTTSQIKKNIDGYKVYLVQLLFGMYMHEVNEGILAVYERPKDFDTEFDSNKLTLFTINRKDYEDLLQDILREINQFEKDLAYIKENPFATEQDLQPNEIIQLSNKVVELENRLKEFKELENQYKDFKDKLFQAMKKNNITKWATDGGVKFALVEIEDKLEIEPKFNEEKFAMENQDLYLKYIEQKEVFKKGKSYLKVTLPKE